MDDSSDLAEVTASHDPQQSMDSSDSDGAQILFAHNFTASDRPGKIKMNQIVPPLHSVKQKLQIEQITPQDEVKHLSLKCVICLTFSSSFSVMFHCNAFMFQSILDRSFPNTKTIRELCPFG
jgi:hypothetical protein